ncbi:MAG: fasciclin domain-containing protein [Bacteroidota bacterium]
MKLRHLLFFIFLAGFVQAQTVVDIIVDSEDHNTLEAAVIAAGLDTTLAGEGPFTVFAPTDAAFEALPEGTVDALLADPNGALTDILLYHAVAATALSGDLTDQQMITTINGKDVIVTINMDGVFINDAQVTVADVIADNGIVHVIDAVLLPPVVTVADIIINSTEHNTLEAAVLAAGLDTILNGEGPFTIFAPTDDAFDALPEGTVDALLADPTGALIDILLYHAVASTAFSTDLTDQQMITTINGKDVVVTINMDGVFINDAQVTMADIETDNGVVHVIDAVLLPPPPTVVDIISDSPDHTLLETAILAAELDGALSGEGPFTIFAPTDAAFQALPAEILDALLADPMGDLSTILQYHVTNDNIASTDLSNRFIGTSINGFDYLITIDNMEAFVNNALITGTDLEASNGIVHVIDAILVPSTTASVIFSSMDFSILSDALFGTGVINNLADLETKTTLFAPTNAAFASLPTDILNTFVDNPDKLVNTLLYHVTPGRTFADELSDGQLLTTVLGETAEITINQDGAFINDAQIIVTDFFTGNGIIHVIDAVLLPAPETVMDVIIRSDAHNTLQAAIEAAELDGVLQDEGTYTVFAPTDAAFDLLPEGTVEALLQEPEGQLTDILLYHVLDTEVLSTDLENGASAQTLNGASVNVTIDMDGNVFINNAQVVIADIQTSNGVVHVIDMVLLPPTSTNDLSPEEVSVYPNPTSEKVSVEYDESLFNNPTIQIVNTNGQLVKQIKNFSANSILNMADLQNGIYNVIISDNENRVVKRITKIQ